MNKEISVFADYLDELIKNNDEICSDEEKDFYYRMKFFPSPHLSKDDQGLEPDTGIIYNVEL